METSTLAALLTAVILVGGVAAAAAMGGFNGLGIGEKSTGAMEHGGHSEDKEKDHGMMGEEHGMMTSEGMHSGETHMSKEERKSRYEHSHEYMGGGCGCSVIENATWYNATVKSVSYEDGYAVFVLDDGNGTEVELYVRGGKAFVDMATGYLVYGPWVLHQLVPNMTVQVLVADIPGPDGQVLKVVGINMDGRTLVMPMAGHDHVSQS